MYILPEKLRAELKKPLGKLHESFRNIDVGDSFLITVGDVTTRNALEHGLKPDVSIIDNRIQRMDSDHEFNDTATIIRSTNPPGTITEDLWNSIKKAIDGARAGERFMIVVDGEEDLAVLPSILMAPADTVILYGQPDEGVVLVRAIETRKRAEELIKNFEEA
ncbi:GTP-dependent dephospho-CoA kinase family protein [Methanothermobacter marburgensis]|uniref:GTP-dependent dephospho-CoA kinase family protein n=1 Tax=Methanothermobacter marburgensis TaxID=145263 RepID=UPI0035B8D6DD